MTEQVLTANRLRDGRVVYRDPQGGWSERLKEAQVFSDAEAAQLALAAAKGEELLVCGPYLFPIGRGGGGELLLSARERIRAAGPSEVIARYAGAPTPRLPLPRPVARAQAALAPREAARVRL